MSKKLRFGDGWSTLEEIQITEKQKRHGEIVKEIIQWTIDAIILILVISMWYTGYYCKAEIIYNPDGKTASVLYTLPPLWIDKIIGKEQPKTPETITNNRKTKKTWRNSKRNNTMDNRCNNTNTSNKYVVHRILLQSRNNI